MIKLPRVGWVYCLWSFDFPWRYKVGFSEKPDYRRADIEASMRREYGSHLKVMCAFKAPMLFAQKFENAIHRSGLWRPVSGMRGSGYTEWSWWLNIVTAIAVYLISWANGNECPHYIAAVVLMIPWPLDYALFIFLFAVFQIVGISAFVYLFYLMI